MGFLIFKPIVESSLSSQNPVVVGICCGEPPYEYLSKEGNVQGINKNLLEDVFKNSKINRKKFKFSIMPFNQSFMALDKGKIDFLATFLTITDKRKELYDFAVICQSKIVCVHRTNTSQSSLVYGLQLEAVFEDIAKKNQLKYTGYSDFQSVMLHFDMKKVDGFICDINTLKQLIEKNFNDITTLLPVKVQWNDNILILSNNGDNKITGVLSNDGAKYASENVRIYNSLKDLLLAFRCEEIKSIVLKKQEITQLFNGLSGLQAKSNSKNLLFKPFLSLRFHKDHWIIEKNNNKKNLIIGALKNNFFEEYKSVKSYDNYEFMINDLMEEKIDGIAFRDFSSLGIEIFGSFANVNKSMDKIYIKNGFAFRKKPINDFDRNDKQNLMEIIENESQNHPQLCEYKSINYKEE
jgi:hypothetical protein